MSIPEDPSLDATRVQVLLSLDALHQENPPYITARPIAALQALFPVRVLDVRLTAHGRSTVTALHKSKAAPGHAPIGFQPPSGQ
jgi:hypothetical protein